MVDGSGGRQGILEMAKAYYSTVFREPAADIWEIVRDFNNYPVWVGGAGESRIEDGKSGDTVGAVRDVVYQERHIRQRLLALSRCRSLADLRILRRTLAAGPRLSGPRLPGDPAHYTNCQRRPRLRRVVGDL
jgi:hypothetical protein